jgi:hypothetical protein
MKVLLNAYDSASPRAGPFANLAIMKLAAHHKDRGDQVALIGKGLTRQDDMPDPDRVYLSCVFSENGSQALGTRWMYDGAEFIAGGSGVSLNTELAPEVTDIPPDYEIYDDRGVPGWPFAIGFSSRGCGRKCPFCVVPRKEGKIKQETPLEEIVGDRDRLMLLDNNLTMDPKVEEKLIWLRDWGGKVNITQGLDARAMIKRPELAQILVDARFTTRKFDRRMITFAYDHPRYSKIVEKCVAVLEEAGFHLKNQVQFYVLVNYDTTLEEDLARVQHLKELGTNPFIMIYKKSTARGELRKLQRWCNLRKAFWAMEYKEFCEAKL